MARRTKTILSLIALAFALVSAPCFAQDEEPATPDTAKEGAPAKVKGAKQAAGTQKVKGKTAESSGDEEQVKTGTIASSGRHGQFGAIDVQTGGDAPGDEPSAISASVTHAPNNQCVANVINNGKKTYSVSFNVVGEDGRGSKVLNKSFSASLKPGAKVERLVSGCRNDLNLQVVLKSARAS